jgi:predicted ATPase
LLDLDRQKEALENIDKALLFVEETGERWPLAELYRLKGEVLISKEQPDYPAAESCFQTGLEIATAQGAKLFVLRILLLLARHQKHFPQLPLARSQLESVYAEFTEGFSHRDLQEVSEFLSEY